MWPTRTRCSRTVRRQHMRRWPDRTRRGCLIGDCRSSMGGMCTPRLRRGVRREERGRIGRIRAIGFQPSAFGWRLPFEPCSANYIGPRGAPLSQREIPRRYAPRDDRRGLTAMRGVARAGARATQQKSNSGRPCTSDGWRRRFGSGFFSKANRQGLQYRENPPAADMHPIAKHLGD